MKLASTHSASSADIPRQADTRLLQGAWLVFARVAWIVLVVCILGYFIASLPQTFVTLHQPCTGAWCTNATGRLTASQIHSLLQAGISLDAYAWSWIVFTGVTALVWFAVGGILFWRKSADWMVLLVALMLISVGADGVTDVLLYSSSLWRFAEQGLYLIVSLTILSTLALFPNGRFVPRWSLWVPLVYPAYLVCYLLFLRPLHIPGWALYYTPFNAVVWFGSWTILTLAQLYRYFRVSTAVERQQTKWVALGFSVVLVAGWVAVSLGSYLSDQHNGLLYALFSPGFSIFSLLLPLSIGIAMLRSHLWDIDIIINRTLVYGTLTACVVALYVLVVLGLGTLLQSRGNLLLSLLATGLIAVLFQPLRARLQLAVNRLMYGERDTPYRVISRLGQRLEATLAPEAVLPTIVETVAQALKLPYAAITLKQEGELVTVVSYGSPRESLTHIPLVYQNEQIGELMLAPRASGESFTPTDRALLDDLARQAGVAARAVRLTSDLLRLTGELQASRTQLVTAREEERRRLRRDLHDGLGSALTSVTFQLDAASNMLERDPQAVRTLLLELKGQMQTSIADIRRLVYNLRPPILDEWGLVAALREQVAQYQLNHVRVTVDAPESLPALPAAVEIAAYRIALEGLANVVRHARASTCNIHLALSDDSLLVEVQDNGEGLPQDYHAGVGISAMRERAAELGGSCIVESMTTGGTRVSARLPGLEE